MLNIKAGKCPGRSLGESPSSLSRQAMCCIDCACSNSMQVMVAVINVQAMHSQCKFSLLDVHGCKAAWRVWCHACPKRTANQIVDSNSFVLSLAIQLLLRVLHLTMHYSMQECASCYYTSCYKTTNHTHNDIHGCLSVCWLP